MLMGRIAGAFIPPQPIQDMYDHLIRGKCIDWNGCMRLPIEGKPLRVASSKAGAFGKNRALMNGICRAAADCLRQGNLQMNELYLWGMEEQFARLRILHGTST